ncbi:autotransporter outer membrane beta-barrel domain-containing protein [Anaerovibrio sp. RM50]|uniref:autotransporter outer membrane beta-barrel domain-containing protein n=1 Tax=Anaerovibrio sp. RM50 TaxID=1200557 RepID=UPI0004884340|nr:autotransporter outer membrane beta-barrel domain-containing protein [Anaerovibrio sp. RM50]
MSSRGGTSNTQYKGVFHKSNINSKKAQMALALAVSLWIGGSGVAWANTIQVPNDEEISGDHSDDAYIFTTDGVSFTMTNGSKAMYIFGANTSGNAIIIKSGASVSEHTNGYSITGGINNNQITMAGTVTDGVYGGYCNGFFMDGVSVTGNQVNFSGTANYVYGGSSEGWSAGTASDNHVVMTGGTVTKSVYGAATPNNNSVAEKNTVTIEGGSVGESVYGAEAYAEAKKNIVTITGGTVELSVYGGSGMGGSQGNIVNISGGTVGNNNDGYYICGGYSSGGEVSGNKVIITGGTIKGDVYGGHTFSGAVSGNSVTLGGGTMEKNVYGGHKGRLGPYEGEHVSTGNILILSGPSVVKGTVGSFETITLDKELTWDPISTVPVLKANHFDNCGALDITGGTKLLNSTTVGKMTLLSANTKYEFRDEPLKLIYNSSTKTAPVVLNSTNKSQVVKSVEDSSSDKGVTLDSVMKHTVSLDNDLKQVDYVISNDVKKVTLGEMTWGDGRVLTGDYDFANLETINTANLKFSNPDEVTGRMDLLSGATNLADGLSISHSQNFSKTINGATLSATLSGNVKSWKKWIQYDDTKTALNSINLTGWDGTEGSVPTGWTSNLGENSIMGTGLAPNVAAGSTTDILTATNGFFNENQIAAAIKYKELASSSDTVSGVTLTGSESKGVQVADSGTKLVYKRSNFDVSNVSFGSMAWGTGRTANGAGYDYSNAAVNLSGLTFNNPEDVTADTKTLLTANNTLRNIDETVHNVSYGYSPVSGVTVDGIINGSYKATGGEISYTATGNNATKLTFGNVEWKDTGALMTRPANITFNGAAVDTTNINFTNIKELEANKKMTLVSDFGNSVGTITGTKYKVGSTLEGEGKATLVDSNEDGTLDALIFTADTSAEKMTVQEQTHNTVMGAEVGMAALSAGNEYVGAATEGLAMAGNVGADGVATYANMGGGSMNVETGSHVKTHTWNAILALGHKNEKKLSSTEYGAFFEYGRGNYSTFNGDERGDGSTHYTGGGILGKWQKNNGFYVEGSLRAGSIHDDATNVLRDVNGNPYSYETDATYWGAHIGVGREIKLNKTDVLDLYAKYFYNHRGSVSFDAGGHYDLDAVESSVLRVGTRYTVKKSDKINYYGGLAIEHEFCGRAAGLADGVAIRGADISGTSLRGEIGATFQPGDNSNVTLDLNLSGFAGKKRGLTGGLSAVFHI